ncbi:protein CFAP20DC-like [Lytechinus variegatus]|uniref:protein CFAP20DC-like n=1 Tax=Lytechinus variegatus TaxID=7654 RepID=UPI001BB1AB37|nr:protein CFAP20DC-like [Lytechinus variegatus]
MFKNEFQGGPFVEVFSSQGKEPLSKWKLSGQTSIQKLFDKECKSYIHTLEGASTTTKIQLPKESKQALLLIQRYLVIQSFIPLGQDFSMELGVTDMGNNKRRLFFSTAQKETSATPLHAKVPLTIIKRAIWLNLTIDMVSLVGEMFRGQTFKSLDTIIISACCKLRKIFTLKDQPGDTTDDDELYDCTPLTNSASDISPVPKACQFTSDVPYHTQILSMSKLRHAEFKLRGDGSRPSSSSEPDLNSSLRAKDDRPTHIAFGTKVYAPQTSSGRKVSAREREGSGHSGSRSSRSSHSRSQASDDPLPSARGVAPSIGEKVDKLVVHGHTRQQSDPGTEIDNPDKVDKDTLTGSKTWTAPVIREDSARHPHPPRENSGGKSRRVVKVRPSSGKKSDASESSDVDLTSARGKQKLSSRGNTSGANTSNASRSDSMAALSTGMQNMNSKSAGRGRTRLDSLSESDDHQEAIGDGRNGRLASGRSKIPRRKKKDRSNGSSKMTGVSEKEELVGSDNVGSRTARSREKKGSSDGVSSVQSVEGRVVKNGDDISVKMGESDSGVAFSVEMSDPEGSHSVVSSSRSIKTDGKDKNALYTFMSPPHTVPVRAPDSSRQLDPSKLQMKMQAILDSSTPSNLSEDKNKDNFDTVKQSSRELISPETDFLRHAQLNDDSDLEDDWQGNGRLNVNRTIERSRSRSPKNRTGDDDGNENISSMPESSRSNQRQQPSMSLSPTLRRSKLASLAQSQGGASQQAARLSVSRMSIRSKHLKEIPKDDPRVSDDYDWRKYQSNNSSLASSLEANMLASLKRQQLEELYEDRNEGAANNSFEIHNYGDDDESSSSDDTNTTISTWKPPDNLRRGKGYQEEMNYAPTGNPLMQSNPRDWSNLFSPPIVLPSEKKLQNEQSQLSPVNEFGSGVLNDGGRHKSTSSDVRGGGGDTDGEEELDLLYDPCLNCYFDPRTGKYYELA